VPGAQRAIGGSRGVELIEAGHDEVGRGDARAQSSRGLPVTFAWQNSVVRRDGSAKTTSGSRPARFWRGDLPTIHIEDRRPRRSPASGRFRSLHLSFITHLSNGALVVPFSL
jgi:hypothetical protein